jgi:hypothetical protein
MRTQPFKPTIIELIQGNWTYPTQHRGHTIEVECEIIETNLLNSQNMQPSEIHLRKELAQCKETKGAEAKKRAKEIEKLLGIDKKIEKATIATDEQQE